MTARPAATLDLEDEVIPETIPMTYEAYLEWYDKEAGRRGEWVDGEVIVFMPATFKHEDLVGFLLTILRFILAHRRLGVAVGSSYEVRTREGAAREPDIVVVLDEHRERIGNRRLSGAPDLAVEVISRDSVTRDRKTKFDEYEAAGVPEYRVFDPRQGHGTVELFTLGRGGKYHRRDSHADGTLHSTIVPGFWFDPAWLLADEKPIESALAMRMAGITFEE